ncbi:hypothetical protein BW247_01695 [Acidihalobacter ferrooxydans]|uniref:General glycosylation pathway protein n=1 Tax=Acidihalobacter ferrooxydans TaxID=1765967 RepID=A0A1P8UKW7_9GAMM|nr:hypothetical protein BW247_01695 [Acidihalobacter ferrooxydans]
MRSVYESFSTGVYLLAAVALTLLSISIMGWSVFEVIDTMFLAKRHLEGSFVPVMLQSVGAIVIAVAIHDVAKYMVDEEVLRTKELRSAVEARETLTKIIVIATIAVTTEALVYIFKAGMRDLSLLVYPVLLLFAVVLLLVGLGVYQRLSFQVENGNKKT